MDYAPLSTAIKNNLADFITATQYDIIISDTILENSKSSDNIKESKYLCIQGKNIRETLNYYCSEYEKYTTILLIIEHNTLDSIIDTISKFPKEKNITILDLHSGVFARGEKSTLPQYSAYSLEDYRFEIYHPIDTLSLKENIKNISTNNRYFAIPDLVLPESLVKDEKLPVVVNYEIEKKIDTGIFAVGYAYIQVGQVLQQEDIKDIMLLVSDSLSFNQKALSHIKELKNLVVIIDSKYPEIIKKNIQAQLYNTKIFDIQLKVITPKYEKLNTILKDYQLQETEFDTEGLVKRLFA